jgi:hypothetical protein
MITDLLSLEPATAFGKKMMIGNCFRRWNNLVRIGPDVVSLLAILHQINAETELRTINSKG